MKFSDGYCKLCNTERENLDHILIKCSHISDVWVRIEQIVYILWETDCMTDFNKIICYMKHEKLHEVINMILSSSHWIIWKRRCINKYEGEYIDLESFLKGILVFYFMLFVMLLLLYIVWIKLYIYIYIYIYIKEAMSERVFVDLFWSAFIHTGDPHVYNMPQYFVEELCDYVQTKVI